MSYTEKQKDILKYASYRSVKPQSFDLLITLQALFNGRKGVEEESLQMNHSHNFGFLKWYKPLSMLFELGFLNMQIIGINLDTFTKRINQWISEKK